jgi:hypothetical protein
MPPLEDIGGTNQSSHEMHASLLYLEECRNWLGSRFEGGTPQETAFELGTVVNWGPQYENPEIQRLSFLGVRTLSFLLQAKRETSWAETSCVMAKRFLFAAQLESHHPNGSFSVQLKETLRRLPDYYSFVLAGSTLCCRGRNCLTCIICTV